MTVINTLATGDTQPPKFTFMDNIIHKATTANGAKVAYKLPTTTDDVGVTYGPVCDPPPGSFFPLGTTVVTCTASDAKLNKASISFKVSITSGITLPEEIPMSVSVKTGKDSYTDSEAVFVAGSVDPVTKNPVALQVRTPDGALAGIEQINPEDFGSYTSIFMPSPLWNKNGTYTVLATYGTGQDTTSFDFEIIPKQQTVLPRFIPTDLTI